MSQAFNSFLGTGWSFPPSFSPELGTVEMVSNEEDIHQSLQILLSTSVGERVMQPDYGCDLNDYLFESLNATVILYYEPRIVVEKIDVTAADSFDIIEGRFTISVDYSIPETNSRFNYVFDYYRNEAINLG